MGIVAPLRLRVWAKREADGQRPERVTLADGTSLWLRAAVEGDAEGLRRMFYRLSPRTIYRRLFLPAPQTEHWAGLFADLARAGGERRLAMVALTGTEVVALANYGMNERDVVCDATAQAAEMAVVVEDAWQGRGLGTALVAALAREAARREVSAFTVTVLGENDGALRFIRRLFPAAQVRWEAGTYLVRAPLATAG